MNGAARGKARRNRDPRRAASIPSRQDHARSTTPQRDEATGTVPATSRDEAYGDLKLPHERDETGDAQATQGSQDRQDPNGPRAVIRQGARDIEAGREDTDCYNANAPRYRKREDGAL